MQCLLEAFKVSHPLKGEVVGLNVRFVKDENEGQFSFVENTASVEHVAHEGCGVVAAWSVDDIGDAGGHGAGEGIGDDSSTGAPSEYFNLTWRVDQNRFGRRFLNEGKNLVKLGGEEVQRGQDATVGAEVIRRHDILIGNRVSNVDVGIEGKFGHSRVQIY